MLARAGAHVTLRGGRRQRFARMPLTTRTTPYIVALCDMVRFRKGVAAIVTSSKLKLMTERMLKIMKDLDKGYYKTIVTAL